MLAENSANGIKAVLFTLKKPSAGDLKRLRRAVGDDIDRLEIVHGVRGLDSFIRGFVGN